MDVAPCTSSLCHEFCQLGKAAPDTGTGVPLHANCARHPSFNQSQGTEASGSQISPLLICQFCYSQQSSSKITKANVPTLDRSRTILSIFRKKINLQFLKLQPYQKYLNCEGFFFFCLFTCSMKLLPLMSFSFCFIQYSSHLCRFLTAPGFSS